MARPTVDRWRWRRRQGRALWPLRVCDRRPRTAVRAYAERPKCQRPTAAVVGTSCVARACRHAGGQQPRQRLLLMETLRRSSHRPAAAPATGDAAAEPAERRAPRAACRCRRRQRRCGAAAPTSGARTSGGIACWPTWRLALRPCWRRSRRSRRTRRRWRYAPSRGDAGGGQGAVRAVAARAAWRPRHRQRVSAPSPLV